MVFQQMAAGEPWRHNGTVHAPDPEMALLNARDVFSRRPDAVGLFVLPDSAIYKVTREQLEHPGQLQNSVEFVEEHKILVFAKPFEQAACEHLGDVQAKSALQALEKARAKFAEQDPLMWWLFPVNAVFESQEGETEPMFAAAREKSYKSSSEYHTVSMMRELRAKGKLEDE